jgi:O-acetylserine/cysteine efflux transporter
MAVAFGGVAIIAGEPRLDGNYGSLALVIGAALIWALSNIQVKRLHALSGWTISAWMSLFAVPQLLLVSSVLEHGQLAALQAAHWAAWGALAYNAFVVMVIGYGIWYWLLRQYEVNVAMPFTLLVPVFGVMSGVFFLGESLTRGLIIGGSLTIVGVAIIVLRRPATTDPIAERV